MNKSQLKICEVCGVDSSTNRIISSRKFKICLCVKHYSQLEYYGKIFKRTKFDPNEIIKYDDYAEIILYNRKSEEVARAIIDLEDVELCSKYKWSVSTGCVATHFNNKRVKLHHLITRFSSVDHKNRNFLDNRKFNLRQATQNKNSLNKSLNKNNTSKCKGVDFCKKRNKWRARINYNYKTFYLGYYVNQSKAIEVRLNKELELFKEFANKELIYETAKQFNIGLRHV